MTTEEWNVLLPRMIAYGMALSTLEVALCGLRGEIEADEIEHYVADLLSRLKKVAEDGDLEALLDLKSL